MAGKKNKQREKLEQNRASSSTRAQEALLASSSSFATSGASGFIGFSAFASNSSVASSASSPFVHGASNALSSASFDADGNANSLSFYDGSDHEIAVALKMLGKKGNVTKTKALQAFRNDIVPPKKPAEIRAFLGHWLYLYANEMKNNNDRRVRQMANEVLVRISEKMRSRAFVPHIRRLLPFWLLAMHDVSSPEVATLAKKSFDQLYGSGVSEEKLQLFEEHMDFVLSTFEEMLKSDIASLSDVPSQPDEQEERYERCLASIIASLPMVLEICVAKETLNDKFLGHNGVEEGAKPQLESLLTSNAFTRMISITSKNPHFTRAMIRKSAYKTVAAVCDCAPQVISRHLDLFGRLALGVFCEKASANHHEMWQLALVFLQRFPQIWQTESQSLRKFFHSACVPRLLAQLRHGFYGSAHNSFPTLLPFLSLVPFEVILDIKPQGKTHHVCDNMYASCLDQLLYWLTSNADAKGHEQVVILTFCELLTAFFTVFLAPTSDVLLRESFSMEGFVNSFKLVFRDALETCVKASFIHAESFQKELLRMTVHVNKFKTTLTKSESDGDQQLVMLQLIFLDSAQDWTRHALFKAIQAPPSEGFAADRVLSFVSALASTYDDHEAFHTVALETSTLVFQKYLERLVAMELHDVQLIENHADDLTKLIETLHGILRAVGVSRICNSLAQPNAEERAEEHLYRVHFRPIAQKLGKLRHCTPTSKRSLCAEVLKLCRVFFAQSIDPHQFCFSLLKDLGIDLRSIELDQQDQCILLSQLLEHVLCFPLECAELSNWEISWQAAKDSTDFDDVHEPSNLHLVQQIWRGEWFDELPKHLSPDLALCTSQDQQDQVLATYSMLMGLLLGKHSCVPLISFNAALDLCRVLKDHVNDAVFCELAEHLLQFMSKLTLNEMLFEVFAHGVVRLLTLANGILAGSAGLSNRGRLAVQASTIYDGHENRIVKTIRHDNGHGSILINTLVSKLNDLFDAKSTVSVDQWTGVCGQALLLLQLVDVEVLDVMERITVFGIDVLDLSATRHAPWLYDRLLSCLGTLCTWKNSILVQKGFIGGVFASNEAKLDLLCQLAEVDVCLALSWFVLQSDRQDDSHLSASQVAVRGANSDEIGFLNPFLSLSPLWQCLQECNLMVKVIETTVQRTLAGKRTQRDSIFTNQNEGSPRKRLEDIQTEFLCESQHDWISRMTLQMLLAVPCDVNAVHQQHDENSSIDELANWSVAFVEEKLDSGVNLDAAKCTLIVRLLACLYRMAKLKSSNRERLTNNVERLAQKFLLDSAKPLALPELLPLMSTWYLSQLHESILQVLDREVTNKPASPPGSKSALVKWRFVSEYLVSSWAFDSDMEPENQAKQREIARAQLISGLQLKLYQPSIPPESPWDNLPPNYLVQHCSLDFWRARVAFLQLWKCLEIDELHEFATHHREAMASLCLSTLADSLTVRHNILAEYLNLFSPTKSIKLVELSHVVTNALVMSMDCLTNAMHCVSALADRKHMVLTAFGSKDRFLQLFDGFKLSLALKCVLYAIAKSSNLLVEQTTDAEISSIDLNAEDESSTEESLAQVLIPKPLQTALEKTYADSNMKRLNGFVASEDAEEAQEELLSALLLWDLFLRLFPKANTTANDRFFTAALSYFVVKRGLLTNFLNLSGGYLQRTSSATRLVVFRDFASVENLLPTLDALAANQFTIANNLEIARICSCVFFRTILKVPALVRAWWNDDCTRSCRSWAAKYFEENITPLIVASELSIITDASNQQQWDSSEMSVRGSKVSREICTTYIKDECSLEMVLKIPSTYPLRSVEVECTKRIGISEDRWRRWMLQILKVSSSSDNGGNGSLLDAVLLWKNNVDKEFEGVEPCPICYSILNAKTMALPNLACKTCSNKYHNACLYKWFTQSGKNKCPICQQPFS